MKLLWLFGKKGKLKKPKAKALDSKPRLLGVQSEALERKIEKAQS
ncbi:hypothetical protein BGP_0103 [Beggiatoa sp. PS]|nr:hypothetical protein BGP_0103 [Beggiatoa sp. PS]